MGLRLFIKEHISFILFELCVVLFILSLYWLDGFRNINTALYSIIISVMLLFSFLAMRYFVRRNYLNKITQLPNVMEDALQKNAKTV
ncbi:sensor histidine kinase, partial [Butyricicoccus sp. 1XD8-22]